MRIMHGACEMAAWESIIWTATGQRDLENALASPLSHSLFLQAHAIGTSCETRRSIGRDPFFRSCIIGGSCGRAGGRGAD
mmetsp:Transcript_484/g.1579  ORF Transcript_484/g.1579 Transcript_484/m.1579 type:complete len:80 (-) Transcript_484:684-923(-)